ncbi:hypothetical protein A0H81_01432 [Grifola frondosa]|uniref:Uncharacterized protein n=1 Tax=Grifola frondosa TaxID=5627 RepID=A0A1C7MTB6_GRIFR|nr:hypothetical protein A0H81_01432 [Grifola frondosa]
MFPVETLVVPLSAREYCGIAIDASSARDNSRFLPVNNQVLGEPLEFSATGTVFSAVQSIIAGHDFFVPPQASGLMVFSSVVSFFSAPSCTRKGSTGWLGTAVPRKES